ncbi:MAG TPA: AAA family ATPase [Polyangiales bacterium]
MNPLEQRPLIIALAGPNGAGKSTFFEAHLRQSGLPFVNADELARELGIDAYRAADAASLVRSNLVAAGQSFVFETVFSDPKQDKVAFLRACEGDGYTVVLCFIGLSEAELSDERVALRSLMGGHDVPRDKLLTRYPRSLANLRAALRELTFVRIFDNSVSNKPHRLVAEVERARVVELALPVPAWATQLLRVHLPAVREFTVQSAAREGLRTSLELEHSDGSLLRLRYRTRKEPPQPGERVCLGPDFAFTRGRSSKSRQLRGRTR